MKSGNPAVARRARALRLRERARSSDVVRDRVLGAALGAAAPAAPAPPPTAAQQRTAAASTLAVERQWLASWFKGTPVVVAQRPDGAVVVDVPREFCFEPGPRHGQAGARRGPRQGRAVAAPHADRRAPPDRRARRRRTAARPSALQRATRVHDYLRAHGVAAGAPRQAVGGERRRGAAAHGGAVAGLSPPNEGARAARRAHRLPSSLRHDFLAARAAPRPLPRPAREAARTPRPPGAALRRIVAAAICLAFVLVPMSALVGAPARRRQGAPAPTAARRRRRARRRARCRPPSPRSCAARACRPRASPSTCASVDGIGASPLVAFHAEQPFLLASTTKVVTSLAALDLLGAAPPLAHQRVRDRPGRRRAPRRRPRHRRRPGRPDRQRAAPLVPADARRRAGDDRRQHRPRRRRAAARARPEAGARRPSSSALPTRRSTRAPTTSASCSSR